MKGKEMSKSKGILVSPEPVTSCGARGQLDPGPFTVTCLLVVQPPLTAECIQESKENSVFCYRGRKNTAESSKNVYWWLLLNQYGIYF